MSAEQDFNSKFNDYQDEGIRKNALKWLKENLAKVKLLLEETPVSNIIEEYSFLPFKDMRKAVNALLDKLAEFRASLDETLSKPPTTPVTEEA